jgi:hypothetical protein
LIVGRHHAKRLLDAQVKGVAHALGDMPAEGAVDGENPST